MRYVLLLHEKHHTCHFLMPWHYLVTKYCSTENFPNHGIHFFCQAAALGTCSYDSFLHILCDVICGSVHHFLGIVGTGTQQ